MLLRCPALLRLAAPQLRSDGLPPPPRPSLSSWIEVLLPYFLRLSVPPPPPNYQ